MTSIIASSTCPALPPPPPPPAGRAHRRGPAAPTPGSRGRRIGWLLRLAFVGAGIAVSLAIDGGILGALLVLFVLVVPFEKLYPRQKGQRVRRPHLGVDLGFALMSPLLNVVGIAAAVVIGATSLMWIPGLVLRPVVAGLPPVVLPYAGIVLFDFLGYWTHRLAHEVPFMWRFHAVHHSPEHMDWVSGFRIHPFDGVLIAPAFFLLIAAGFEAELVGVLAVVQVVLGIFFHANVRVRWRWLDRIAANPEFHHWHHANERDAIGHNYAPALPLWDQLFGTFFMPKSARRPQHYGVDGYVPRTLVAHLVSPCHGARRHLRSLRHPVVAARSLRRGTAVVLGDIARSVRRPTHSIRVQTLPGCSSTNASLLSPTTRQEDGRRMHGFVRSSG